MAGELGLFVLGCSAAPDASRRLHLDLLTHLLHWHCPAQEGYIEESALFRLGHSILALRFCRGMWKRLRALFRESTFPYWLMANINGTDIERAYLLRAFCRASLGGDVRMVLLLRTVQGRINLAALQRPIMGCDLAESLYDSYRPCDRSRSASVQRLGLAIGPYGWYAIGWAVEYTIPHPLGDCHGEWTTQFRCFGHLGKLSMLKY
jgi:hypothetical protein